MLRLTLLVLEVGLHGNDDMLYFLAEVTLSGGRGSGLVMTRSALRPEIAVCLQPCTLQCTSTFRAATRTSSRFACSTAAAYCNARPRGHQDELAVRLQHCHGMLQCVSMGVASKTSSRSALRTAAVRVHCCRGMLRCASMLRRGLQDELLSHT
jgi:hypothetical protein